MITRFALSRHFLLCENRPEQADLPLGDNGEQIKKKEKTRKRKKKITR